MPAIKPSADLLSSAGIERLHAEMSPWTRAQLAATVAVLLAEGRLNAKERHYAAGILEFLARDVERLVREALSEHIKHCALLPASIARALARDIETVALPIIRYSPVLSEADLIEIVRHGDLTRQLTVAQRGDIGATVSEALVETHDKRVVGTLLENRSADIGEGSFHKILDGFGRDETIQALIVERPALPAAIIERTITRVSDALRRRLVERHGLPEALAGDLIAQGRESALANSIKPAAAGAVEGLARRLHAEGSLTTTFLLRALCLGQIQLFTAGLAARAGIPAKNANDLIRDRGRAGLVSLYTKADLPSELLTAFRIALDIVFEVAPKQPSDWSERDTQRIIQRLVVAYGSIAPAHLEAVLAQLARHGGARSGPARTVA